MGKRKKRRNKKKYNSQYCWPAAVQFESDGVVGRANVSASVHSVAGPVRQESERVSERIIYFIIFQQIQPNTNNHK